MTTSTRSTTASLRSRRHVTARLFTALVAAGLASTVAYAQQAITGSAGVLSASGLGTGTAASGSTPGTFLDVSAAGSNSSSAVLGAGNSRDSLTLSNGYIGTAANFSINQLVFNGSATTNSSLSGANYNNFDPAVGGGRTITLGAGGMTNSAAQGAVYLDSNLTIDTGTTSQTWTSGNKALNVYGNVKGAGTIAISGLNVNVRNAATSEFSGTWVVNGSGQLNVMTAGALGATSTVLVKNTGALHIATTGTTIANDIRIGAGFTGGSLTVAHGLTSTFSGNISNDTEASVKLTIKTNASNTTTIANVTGDLSGHVGTVILGTDSTGFTANFSDTSTLSFSIGANKTVDGVTTNATNALIRAGAVDTNVTAVGFNGKFSIDLTAANATAGNSWNLVDATTLNETYGATFSVSSTADAFTNSGGVWSLTKDGSIWSFNQSTGALSVASASAVPEPSTYAALAGLGVLGFAACRRRRTS